MILRKKSRYKNRENSHFSKQLYKWNEISHAECWSYFCETVLNCEYIFLKSDKVLTVGGVVVIGVTLRIETSGKPGG